MQNTWLAFLYTLAPLLPFRFPLFLVALEDEKCPLLSPSFYVPCVFL